MKITEYWRKAEYKNCVIYLIEFLANRTNGGTYATVLRLSVCRRLSVGVSVTLCYSDPIPTWLLKICASVLTPTVTNIVNLSLSSGQFHPILKESVISPLLKKPTLYKNQLSNTGQSPTSLSYPK